VRTYRIRSTDYCYTPGLMDLARRQWLFDPAWSIKLLTDGFSLPAAIAEGVASGAIEYRIDDETVVIEVTEVAL